MIQEQLKSLMFDLNDKEAFNQQTFALLNSKRLSAKENMGIDKALFEAFTPTSTPIFRVYMWEESFTYGISQKLADIEKLEDLKHYKTNHAQRITGGGILFHGNDISYSLMIPIAYVKHLSVKESYEVICRFLITFYKALGLNPIYAKDSKTIVLSKSDYCQEGYEPYDMLIEGKKVGGNAQRRLKKTLFQHGSISIDNRRYSRGYSLKDLGVEIDFEEAKAQLIKSFTTTFNIKFKAIDKDSMDAS